MITSLQTSDSGGLALQGGGGVKDGDEVNECKVSFGDSFG